MGSLPITKETEKEIEPIRILKVPDSDSAPRMKSHRKSRSGCRNCKIRKVKCDESRPGCKQCMGFRVYCNYNLEALCHQASHAWNTDLQASIPRDCSVNKCMLGIINKSVTSNPLGYELHMYDLENLSRFQTTVVNTLGTAKNIPLYRREVFRLACLHPFVMHAIVALVAKHDRLVSQSPYDPPTTLEIYHEYTATALLNRKLTLPLLPGDCDAIGAVGAILGAWTLASVEASTPEGAWPLKPPSPDDLHWLKFSDGKRELLRIADPFRTESCFRSIFDEYLEQTRITDQAELTFAKLPNQFLELFNFKADSCPVSNPYHRAVQSVALLWNVECNHNNCLRFFAFTSDIQEDYRTLLIRKDPRALLLMAFWYAKVCRYQWWIARRAMIECQAICIYLERYHPNEGLIQNLLSYPKTRCGLLGNALAHLHSNESVLCT